MKKFTLMQTQLSELANLSVGRRIRFIREVLQKEYGNLFSGKSVANRIQVISPSTLTMIEKEKTKDVYFGVITALAKDFGVEISLFTDDFYNETLPISIDLIPAYFISDEPKSSLPEATETLRQNELSGCNPLLESSNIIKVQIRKVAANLDEQQIFSFKSQEKFSQQQLFSLLSTVINHVNTLDVLINPVLKNEHQIHDPLKLAQEYLYHAENSLAAFPWYEHENMVSVENQLHTEAVGYTQFLQQKRDKKLEVNSNEESTK
ncbi:hypothetical protein LYSIN_03350 [Lysinibacillus sphaericus]|uniref:Uncharacterized protein n=1 Tax=Lysinibacillus sphaericus TaxID=1421 RepID=A0A2S5CW35_LYSSH|nr:helix-turn-helix domain-containing protein [Lysinibacillus sphaericus]POZ55053.1 hypothetical protein LYSIN_03350 [Lysinibacillus sphaericus]